jgi:hypothetical protein
VTPEYAFGSDRIILEQGDTDDTYFQRCPHLGGGWPYLLNEDDAGKTVGQDLPVQELFDNGKTIIIARGTKTETGEVTSTTKIRWELSFTRVAKEKLSGK